MNNQERCHIEGKIQDLQAKISKCTASDGDLKFKLQYELDGLLLMKVDDAKPIPVRLTRTGNQMWVIQGGKK